jgi:O-antigen/teichoic acid export membrane protein
MRQRIIRRLFAPPDSNRGRIIDSAVWTMGERFLTLGLTFVVSVIVANYLGVGQFGQLAFAVAIATLFGTIVTGGLSGLVVRDLVRRPEERYAILGTVFMVRLVAAVISLAALLATTFFVVDPETADHLLMAIIALTLLFRVSEVFEFWFQSQTNLRYVSIANVSSALAGNASRLSLVALGAPLLTFAWVVTLESLLSSSIVAGIYRATVGPVTRWRFERGRARAYLTQSWPLIVSGVFNQVNLRVDQVLLGTMLGSAAVGTYAVAARLSEVWYFVPTALAAAVFPTIIRAREAGEAEYRLRLRQLYGAFIWGAIAVAVVVSFAGGPLIRLLYTPEFAEAADVLVIHVWAAPFLFSGVILSKWLIIEGLLINSMVRHGFGAGLNVILNLILIPRHGPVGSAVATLVSYAASTYGACFLSRRTWPAATDMTLGFLLPLQMAYRSAERRLRPGLS